MKLKLIFSQMSYKLKKDRDTIFICIVLDENFYRIYFDYASRYLKTYGSKSPRIHRNDQLNFMRESNRAIQQYIKAVDLLTIKHGVIYE